jgi:hypothetical protein
MMSKIWQSLKNYQNSVRKKSFGGTFCFLNCHIIGLDTGGLKRILNHQESRTLENHNMVKFRALLVEASLHKNGQQQTCLQCTCSVSLRAPSQHREMEQTNDTYLKLSS